MKKVLTNRVVLNTFIMTLFIFSIEMIIRNFAESKLFDFGTIRILLASFICGLGISFITHFFKKLPARIIHIVFVLAIGLYEFIEFGLFNFIGFFMGVGNTEQGTKVISYILDFLKSLKMEYYFILLPTILFVLYYIFIDRKIMKNKTRNESLTMAQKIYIEAVTVIVLFISSFGYYEILKNNVGMNELQTDSVYSLWLYPENSNLAVDNYGVLTYGFCDIKSIVLKIDADKVINIENKKEDKKNEKHDEVVTDMTRTIDDTAWKMVIDTTTDETYKTLNNYFINRKITDKNEMTGKFEGKNLIVILLESVNEIAILNKEDFPTLSKMYNEGISFRNNYTPRNNCSTGNNEFTALTSLFTINNTCTANTYASNKYFTAAFNIFNNKGYYTSSYHDYTQKYYRRGKIHVNLGSQKFYGVTDLGMTYEEPYEEWPSDVDMFKSAQKYYMNKDKFMSYFATVTTHQPYFQSSKMGDKYMNDEKFSGYSTSLRRYLSKMKTLDEALSELLSELESEGKLEDTVIAMFGDHFPYGLTDSEINEYLSKNADYTISRNSNKNKNVDRTPMLIYNAGMESIVVNDYTSPLDLLPTLLNLFNMDYDPRLYLGTDIFSKDHASRVAFADGSWTDEYGYYSAPNSKMTYKDGTTKTYTNAEIAAINADIRERQRMSTSAIKSNYFNYLGTELEKAKNKLSSN